MKKLKKQTGAKNQQTGDAIPPIPDSVQVGVIKDFVDIYENCTECPPEFLWSAMTTVLGLVLSPYATRGHFFPTEPRLYTCNIGQSGVTRKSTGANAATKVVKSAVNNHLKEALNMVEGFGSSEGLLRTLEQADGVPTLVYLDEMELLFKKTTMAGSAGITPLHVLYENNEYQHILKNKRGSLEIRDAHLGLLANSTTDRFPDLWESESIDNGFLSRWMLVGGAAKVRIANPPVPDPVKLTKLQDTIKQIVDEVVRKANGGKLTIDFENDDARKAWEDYYVNEIDPSSALYNRIDTIGERLMVILTLAQAKFVIDLKTVLAIIDFLRYQVTVRRVLCPVIAHNPQAAMEQKIIAKLPKLGNSAKRRDLYRAVHADRYGTYVFNHAIQGLIREGVLTQNLDKVLKRAA